MSDLQGIQGVFGFSYVRPAASAPSGLKPYAPVESAAQADYLRARTRLLRLYDHLQQLAELANIKSRVKLDLPDAQSLSALGLDMTHTAATLNSSDEINASPMSFTPFGPEWDNGSSAEITIGGEYDGSHGTGALSFEVRRAGTHGVDNLRIRVEDPQAGVIRSFNIRANDAADQQYDLQNGLYLTLGPGDLINLDTTTIQVYDNVGAAVDPARPLGGVRNSNPNLQFGMPAIVDGSLQLNGANISVSTADTLNDVIDRINQSSSGVSATFNAMTERVDILQNTLGSAAMIDLQNDTSNLLQAIKLDSINTVAGIDPETIQVMDDVAAFSSVSSGNFVINETQIAVDTATDSLETIIDRINSSSAGVVASFDEVSQRVLIEAQDSASRLDIDSNGTGLFAAFNMPEGRVDPEALARGISRQRSYRLADSVSDVFAELNYLFRDSSFVGRGENASAFRSPLRGAIQSALGSFDAGANMGLNFDTSDAALNRGDFASLDRRVFTNSLQFGGDAVIDALAGSNDSRGLIEGLLNGTAQALKIVASFMGQGGAFVDTYA